MLAESSTEGTKAIANQYELVRATTDEERKRTSEALQRDLRAGDRRDLRAVPPDQRAFLEIVRQMKEMSGAMQREMETTRTELRRGILELPQETAESAAQMRRVIVEQIDALAELNRIVARHSRDTRRAGAPRRADGGERRRARRGAPGALRGRAASGAASSEPRGRAGRRRRQPAPPRRSRRAAAPEARSGGWLSDLLGRAAREEPARAREPTSARRAAPWSRSTRLSVDIARMIDHDAAAELWERYKRGERNVFTRRLYTMQGQQTFEEIRKRYRADREFKQTVDRYIGEFERLLEEVSQGERGQATARSYLTSDTGKVYTMLAHAAGRFEGNG